jgi:GTPase SAR1 family protein
MIPQPIWQLKLVLVGESSVGKSSILSRFVDDQFN